ncbi:alpha/beta fold hydrolase [Pedobacter sp. GR22-6]|uniref:alpha/beta fold hydrolase n=1 Tax=Pedobacter sp. GR22-6 TaxID=3127957 RepID=UPI00307D3C39
MTQSPLLKNNVSIEGNFAAAETMVFANGFGTDQTAWKEVKAAFAAEYRLVLFDNVGGGKADPEAYSPIKYNTLKTYADDMLGILKELQLKDIILVAHSVSSMIGLLAAVKAPEYFSRIVFIGASPRYLNDESAGYTGGFTQPVLDDMYEEMTNNYYAWVSGFSNMAMANPDRPELGQYFASTLLEIRPDIALSVSKLIFESDLRTELSKLNKPVLLLQAHNDVAVPDEVAVYLNQHIQGSILKTVDAEGHFPHISAAAQVIDNIKPFLVN